MMQKRRQKVMELFLDAKRTPKGCLQDVKRSWSYFGRQKVADEKGRQKVMALAFSFAILLPRLVFVKRSFYLFNPRFDLSNGF